MYLLILPGIVSRPLAIARVSSHPPGPDNEVHYTSKVSNITDDTAILKRIHYIGSELHHGKTETRNGSKAGRPEPSQLHDIRAIPGPRDPHTTASPYAGRAPSVYAGRANQFSRHCITTFPRR